MTEIHDHRGRPVRHGRARVNGIRVHYVTAGEGPALLLVHGTPKTNIDWYLLIPLLSQHFTVVAPDLRGFGDTDRPPAAAGYDSLTNAQDLDGLMTFLGHERYHVHGEDRGAEFAYVLAATRRDRVLSLSFGEMMLSGLGLEENSYFTEENLSARYQERGVWQWHLPFFFMPDVPEMLITGRERQFWSWWMKTETWNPAVIDVEFMDELLEHLTAPGGLRGVMETYRSAFVNARLNRELSRTPLTQPVGAIGAPEFFGALVGTQMRSVASRVVVDEVYAECGHSLALEAPERLAGTLLHLASFA